MKKLNLKKSTKSVAALALGALLSTAAIAPQIVFAHGDEQHVTVTITDKGYSPSSVNVKGGEKVALKFVSKGSGCGNAVTIRSLKKSFTLNKGQTKTIVFTPKKGQTIAFACSMNMFKGKAVAK